MMDAYTHGFKDGWQFALDRALMLVDAEAWEYCDYLLRALNGNSDYQRHVSAVSSNIRERIQEEKDKHKEVPV